MRTNCRLASQLLQVLSVTLTVRIQAFLAYACVALLQTL